MHEGMDVDGLARRLRVHSGWQGPATSPGGPALILLCGLPGTGKSFLAEAIATRSPVAVLRSDAVRKAIFKQPRYTSKENGIVYWCCYSLLRALLSDRWSVVFDATNLTKDGRRRAQGIASAAGAPCLTLMTVAPPEVVAERLQRRTNGQMESFCSDATWEVHQKLASSAEPVSEPGIVVDTSQSIAPVLAVANRFLGGTSPLHVGAKHAQPGAPATPQIGQSRQSSSG